MKNEDDYYKLDKRNPFILGIKNVTVSDFGQKSLTVRDDGVSEFLCNPEIPDARCLVKWIQNFHEIHPGHFQSVTILKKQNEGQVTTSNTKLP